MNDLRSEVREYFDTILDISEEQLEDLVENIFLTETEDEIRERLAWCRSDDVDFQERA